MPETDYDLVINVHVCLNSLSGMSVACENKALNPSQTVLYNVPCDALWDGYKMAKQCANQRNW